MNQEIAMRKRCSSLEDKIGHQEIKHDRKVSNIASRLEDYGYKVETHLEYYDVNSGKVLGEVDILAFDKYGVMNIEVKTNNGSMFKGYEQLDRFKSYFPQVSVINSLLITKRGVYRVRGV